MAKIWGERLAVFLIFVSLGIIWSGVMPLWQGPDEPAQFAYVQSMEHRLLPPRQDVVPAGQSPWLFNPSPAESLSITLSARARVLQDPGAWLSLSETQRTQDLQDLARVSARPQYSLMGTQNYVEIYPPLYYDAAAWGLRAGHIRNILAAAYRARFFSALWLGVAGVLWDMILAFVIRARFARLGLLACLVLLIPTIGMLGGTVSNDIVADAASLGIFCGALWGMRNPGRLTALPGAAGCGLVAGLAVWTKEEAYLALAVSAPFVLRAVWRHALSWQTRGAWLGIAGAAAALISAPWMAFTLHHYHSLIPPLTYQGEGSNPRTWAFVLHHELLNKVFEGNLMVTQAAFGMDCPWWQPWASSEPWLHILLGLVEILGLSAALISSRRQPGWGLAAAWLVIGAAVLWALQGEYNVLTGADFLQGRYFLFLAGPVSWLVAHLWIKLPKFGQGLGLAGAAVLSLATMSHTLWRYYHHTLFAFLLGRIVILAPASAVDLSRLSVVLLTAAWVWLEIRLVNGPDSSRAAEAPETVHAPSS